MPYDILSTTITYQDGCLNKIHICHHVLTSIYFPIVLLIKLFQIMFRSISVSVDLECPENLRVDKKMSHNYYLRSRDQRYRTVSECVGPTAMSTQDGPGFRHKLFASPVKFPFQSLPYDLKAQIFSYLDVKDRGIVGQVCNDWNRIIKRPSLWGRVDLTAFPHCNQNHGDCNKLCYALYKSKLRKFIGYLQEIRPILKRLRLAFDIGDHEDGWLECLNHFFDAAHLRELEYLYFNWRETPTKPYWEAENLTWTSSDAKDLMQKHRHRQRLFVNLFDQITARAPLITHLQLPFEWSARSLHALTRLTRLESLVLEKYFVFQGLHQDSLDQLFQSVPNLRNLILEVWTPSGPGLQFYTMHSQSLQYLDISQCRGFYLHSVKLPALQVFKISRHPWNGPLISADMISIPCIYRVLCEGSPDLRQINEHVLKPDWRHNLYEELQVVFKSVCSCREHKAVGWAM